MLFSHCPGRRSWWSSFSKSWSLSESESPSCRAHSQLLLWMTSQFGCQQLHHSLRKAWPCLVPGNLPLSPINAQRNVQNQPSYASQLGAGFGSQRSRAGPVVSGSPGPAFSAPRVQTGWSAVSPLWRLCTVTGLHRLPLAFTPLCKCAERRGSCCLRGVAAARGAVDHARSSPGP